MCRRTTCETCGKITWAGCGAHVDQVMAGIPPKDRCSCPREVPKPRRFDWRRPWSFFL